MKIAKFIVNPFSQNTYIMWDEDSKEAAIVDPGMLFEKEIIAVDNFIQKNNLELKYMLLTHLHLDHSFGCKHITDKYGLEIYGDEAENPLGALIPKQSEIYGIEGDIVALQVSKNLTEKDTLYLGKEEIKILSVPGHSPGSIVYYLPQSSCIIAGDVLFEHSIGRTDLLGGDYGTLISGIKSKLLILPADTTVYSGHGNSTSIGEEAVYNPYLQQ